MPIQVKACPTCDRQLSKAQGFYPQYWCSNCGQGYTNSEVEIRTKHTNMNKVRSDRHEKNAANKVNGRTTLASGALPFDKGDVKNSLLRMECKTTEKKSIVLKRALLLKIQRETEMGKIPVFNVQFEHPTGDLNYYVLDEGWFLQLLDLWEKENNEENHEDRRP